MQEFKLPDLGEGMQEAEIRRWLVKPGDVLKIDQPMVEVETDKAVVEIPSPLAGRIATIRVQEGQVAKLGEVLVTFEGTGDSAIARPTAGEQRARIADTPQTVSATSVAAQLAAPSSPASTVHRVLAAPAVRKRAFELGIDLEKVPPSQPNGRVTMNDVLAYTEQATRVVLTPASPATAQNGASTPPAQTIEKVHTPVVPATPAVSAPMAEERKPLTGLRRSIAERMERSWRTIPHATAFDEVDGTQLVALRQSLKPFAEQRGVRLTYMPLLVKLLLPLLKEFPIFNASLDEQTREIIYKHSYHIGIATDSPEGLLVTVLRDANHLTLLELARQLEHLVAGAQKRTLSLSEVTGSTFTLNNVGSFGGSSGTPIINYPEVAILAVGRLQEKAVVQDGSLVARTMMPLALSFDHRLIDGALAGRFLARFKVLVEQPQQLMLDMN